MDCEVFFNLFFNLFMDLNVYLKIESDVVGLVSFILGRGLCPVASSTRHARIRTLIQWN